MSPFGRKPRVKITSFVLLAIAARSFIAAGWMLQVPEIGGVGVPTLVICPQQNPGLGEWLSDQTLSHRHHHGGSDAPTSGGSLSVLDPGCAMWAGSAVGALAHIDLTAPLQFEAPQPDPWRQFIYRRRPPTRHLARAPPVLS